MNREVQFVVEMSFLTVHDRWVMTPPEIEPKT